MWIKTIHLVSKPLGIMMMLAVLGAATLNAQQAIPTLPASIHIENSNEHQMRGPSVVLPPVMSTTTAPMLFCPSIGTIYMIDKGHNKVCLGWDNDQNFENIMFRYTETGTTNYRTITISGDPNPGSFFIQGLVELTSYDFQVSTKCFTGFTSNWTTPLTISTFAEPVPRLSNNNLSKNNVSIGPNPASNNTTIAFPVLNDKPHNVTIVSTCGREHYRTQVSSADGQIQLPIDVSTFPPGVYFVQVQTGVNYIAKRLIIQ